MNRNSLVLPMLFAISLGGCPPPSEAPNNISLGDNDQASGDNVEDSEEGVGNDGSSIDAPAAAPGILDEGICGLRTIRDLPGAGHLRCDSGFRYTVDKPELGLAVLMGYGVCSDLDYSSLDDSLIYQVGEGGVILTGYRLHTIEGEQSLYEVIDEQNLMLRVVEGCLAVTSRDDPNEMVLPFDPNNADEQILELFPDLDDECPEGFPLIASRGQVCVVPEVDNVCVSCRSTDLGWESRFDATISYRAIGSVLGAETVCTDGRVVDVADGDRFTVSISTVTRYSVSAHPEDLGYLPGEEPVEPVGAFDPNQFGKFDPNDFSFDDPTGSIGFPEFFGSGGP